MKAEELVKLVNELKQEDYRFEGFIYMNLQTYEKILAEEKEKVNINNITHVCGIPIKFNEYIEEDKIYFSETLLTEEQKEELKRQEMI